jgi:hypothetical protein
MPPPTALNVGRRGAPIERSEWARWGNLRPEQVPHLLWPPLPKGCVMDMTADVGEAEGRRHFVTTAG